MNLISLERIAKAYGPEGEFSWHVLRPQNPGGTGLAVAKLAGSLALSSRCQAGTVNGSARATVSVWTRTNG